MTFYRDIEFLTAYVGVEGRSWVNHLSGRNYYTLQYQHYGRIHFTINAAEQFTVEAPSLLITRPGATCHFGSESQPWHHNYLGFRGKRVDRMVAEGLLPLAPAKETRFVKIREGDVFMALFRKCVSHARAGTPIDHALAANAFERLLVYLASEDRSSKPLNPSRSRIEELVRQIRSSPIGAWDFAQIARKEHMSKVHFARLFRDAAGMPPKRFLLKCRMDLAAEMLAESTDPIKTIAATVGFDDIHYFYRKFRRFHRLAPAAFRQKFSRAYQFGEEPLPRSRH